MRSKILDLLYSEAPNLPNSFTIALGEQVRKARFEARISQDELAERAYLKQSSISKIEAGTRAVSAEDLLYLSDALDKPITYFFPKHFTEDLHEEELSPLQKNY